MSTTIPAKRMQPSERASRQYAAILRLSNSIELDRELRELIDVRASQINGCAFCLDMHWKDARAAGEVEERLYMLDAWQESSVYSDRERAALELCEAITLIDAGHVPDEVWDRARASFDEDDLSQLVFAITTINAWNRILITMPSSATRLQKSHESSAVHPQPLASWRHALGTRSKPAARATQPAPTSNARWSMHSSPPPRPATSRRCLSCLIRRSRSAATVVDSSPQHVRSSPEPSGWRESSPGSPTTSGSSSRCRRSSSTALPACCSRRAARPA
jgi:AhpD family alkylhydroperoxidase